MNTPRFSASLAIGTSAWPIIAITGICGSIAWMRANSVSPSMPGIRTSVTTTLSKPG